jgi:hypothetical protein
LFSYSEIASVTIPSSIKSVDVSSFNDAKSLIEINVSEENTNYTSVDGVLFNKSGTTLLFYPEGRQSATYEIPVGVTHIGDYAFHNVGSVNSLTIPAGVTHIGDYAFYNLDAVTSLTIPAGVTHIGDYAFYYMEALDEMYFLGDAPTFLGEYVFGYSCYYSNALKIFVSSELDGYDDWENYSCVEVERF